MTSLCKSSPAFWRSLFSILIPVWIFVLFLAPSPRGATEPFIINDDLESIYLADHVEYLIDETNALTAEEIKNLPEERWHKTKNGNMSFGQSPHPHWFRFRIEKRNRNNTRYLLEIDFPNLDYADLHFVNSDGKWDIFRSGKMIPPEKRPLKNNTYLFPLPENRNVSDPLLFRVQSVDSSVVVPLYLWRKSTFHSTNITKQLVAGLYYGLIIFVSIYNFFLFISIRDKVYLHYIAFHVALLLYSLIIQGYAYLYFWGVSSKISYLTVYIVFLPVVTASIFTRTYFNTASISRKIDRYLLFLNYIGLFGASLFTVSRLFIPSVPEKFGIFFVNQYAVLVCFSLFVIGLVLFVKKIRAAYFYFPAWSIFFICAMIRTISFNGHSISSVFVQYSIQTGSIIEAMLLSLALADRINIMRRDKEIAQSERMDTLQENYRLKEEFTRSLEEKITERTRELRESEEKYRMLVELSPDAVFVYSDKNIFFANSAGVSLLGGQNRSDLKERSLIEFIHPDSAGTLEENIQQFMNNDKIRQVLEEKFCIKDGRTIEMDIHSTPLIYNNKPAILSIGRDITERKRVERLRLDTENMVRHDLRNPLTGIMAFSEFILDESQDSIIQSHASTILNNANLMVNMLNSSLDLFKMEEGTYTPELEDVNLIEIFGELNKESLPLQNQKSIKMNYRIHDNEVKWSEVYNVSGVKFHLKSMFANLLQNAIEASPENKEISVNIRTKNNYHEIIIHNHGAIPEFIRNSFFERYVTCGKKRGTGIGTYSALLIAQSLNGNIQFNTSKENGTDLIVTLPV